MPTLAETCPLEYQIQVAALEEKLKLSRGVDLSVEERATLVIGAILGDASLVSPQAFKYLDRRFNSPQPRETKITPEKGNGKGLKKRGKK